MTLDELIELDAKSTEAPWFPGKDGLGNSNVIITSDTTLFSNEGHGTDNPEEDMRLIAGLRNLAPFFIDLWQACKNEKEYLPATVFNALDALDKLRES
jgi:hypothetical protein